MIIKIAEGTLKTIYGEYREILFYDGQKETIAMVSGEVANRENVLCRVHSTCIGGHYFNSSECECQAEMQISQQLIKESGQGIIILLDQEGKGNGHFALLKSKDFKAKGYSQADAYQAVGFKKDARSFTQTAEILKEIGVKSIILLTNNSKKIEELKKFGIDVVGIKEIAL